MSEDTYKGYSSGDIESTSLLLSDDYEEIADWLVEEGEVVTGEAIENIVNCYDQASENERRIINFMLVELLGYQLQSILKKGE